ALAASCDRAPARDVTTTNAALRGPELLPPRSQTVDSAGFVDNAGRTSDERSRTEASGMRVTETGSQIPTGTPGSGFPLQLEPDARARRRERPLPDRWALGEPVPSGATARIVAQGVAQA